jgi:hypothetical protein
MTDTAPSTHKVHRFIVPTLLVVATLVGFVGAFAVWVNRQALNTDNWVSTSRRLLVDEKVKNAVSGFLVNELFTNVDVAGELRTVLPAQAQALAGPAASGIQQLADRAAPELLSRPRVVDGWVAANTAAHKELISILNGGSKTVSTQNGEVVLNLHDLVTQLAASLGLQSQAAAVQSKLQGSAGAQARTTAQQKLGITLPASSGRLVIMRSNQLKTAQDIANAVKHLAVALPLLAVALFALAVWLARGRRRTTLRTAGWCFVLVGVLLLLIRRVGGNQVVNSLVKVPSNKPAVHDAWNIATSLLYAIAIATIVYGIVTVLAAWLGGSTRPATFLRKSLAPTLRDRPAMAYIVVLAALLLVVVWGPTPAFRKLWSIAVFAALLAVGVTALRRQTAVEFARVQHGDAMRELRARWAAARARRAAPPPREPARPNHLDEIERLVALHDRGALTDEEFEVEKTHLVNGA